MRHRLLGFLLIDLGIAAIVVSVIADLADSASLALRIVGGALIVGGVVELLSAWFLYPRSRTDDELEEFGRPARASVIGVDHRGVTGTGEQVARLRLRVTPANERPFTARREVTLPDAPEIGEQVEVKFDPHHRRRVLVLGPVSGDF